MPSWVDRAGDAVRGAIRAYHASPHNFAKFDASKIGTGEGEQAYGHGLYFAQSPAVMEEYYKNFKAAAPGQRKAFNPIVTEHADEVLRRQGNLAAALKELRDDFDYLSQSSPHEATQYRDAMDYLLGSARPSRPTRYEVEIDYPEATLLDLDAPATGPHKAALLEAAFDAPQNKWQQMAIEEIASRSTPSQVAMGSLMRAHNAEKANKMAGRMSSQAAVADSLFRAGVPGARYFDQVSRSAGQGTRNYVMFPGTEDSISILRKYGLLPATLGAEGLVNQQQPGE